MIRNLIENHTSFPKFKNPYRNLKSENSQDYAQKPQQNCTIMNSASGHILKDDVNGFSYTSIICFMGDVMSSPIKITLGETIFKIFGDTYRALQMQECERKETVGYSAFPDVPWAAIYGLESN
jgi:hypothetical protein